MDCRAYEFSFAMDRQRRCNKRKVAARKLYKMVLFVFFCILIILKIG